jgi:hypothetical protein
MGGQCCSALADWRGGAASWRAEWMRNQRAEPCQVPVGTGCRSSRLPACTQLSIASGNNDKSVKNQMTSRETLNTDLTVIYATLNSVGTDS